MDGVEKGNPEIGDTSVEIPASTTMAGSIQMVTEYQNRLEYLKLDNSVHFISTYIRQWLLSSPSRFLKSRKMDFALCFQVKH